MKDITSLSSLASDEWRYYLLSPTNDDNQDIIICVSLLLHFPLIKCHLNLFIWYTILIEQDVFFQEVLFNLYNSSRKYLIRITRGSVGWACVTHLSFCFVET